MTLSLDNYPFDQFDEHLGIRLVEATPDRAVSLTPVRPDLRQVFGIVHGGVYTAIIESLASIAANLWLGLAGDAEAHAVGVSNHTDFIRPVRSGSLRAEATPLQRGRTLQIWQVAVTDDDGRLCAHGKVRLANLPGRSNQQP
ncbi:MAG: PaaI family thioesterase [Egibacteraceae bacterium]